MNNTIIYSVDQAINIRLTQAQVIFLNENKLIVINTFGRLFLKTRHIRQILRLKYE